MLRGGVDTPNLALVLNSRRIRIAGIKKGVRKQATTKTTRSIAIQIDVALAVFLVPTITSCCYLDLYILQL